MLAESDLFGDLDRKERDGLARSARVAFIDPGEFLFREGDPAETIYIVAEGRIAVEVGLAGRKRLRSATVAVARSCDAVGWSAGIGSEQYTASARAVEKTVAVGIDRSAVCRLLDENPASGLRIVEKLARLARSRLCSATGLLACMASTAAHDLKSPLAAIQSFHQVILGGYAGEISAQQEHMLVRAGERIKGLVSMIDDIFDLSRTGLGALEDTSEISVAETAEAAMKSVAYRAAAAGVVLAADWSGGLPGIRGEPLLLRQAMVNLLDNAIKFSESGGKVALKITDNDDREEILVEVTDNGPGIPKEELPRIFDDFFRGADAPAGGAGVGLSIVRRIVEAHGGRIWAESPYPGSENGTRCTFTLPRRMTRPGKGKKGDMHGHESRN